LLQGHGHRDAQLGVVFLIIRYGDDFDVRTTGRGREGRRRATVFEGTFRANDAAEILEVEFPFLLVLLLAVSVQVAGEDIVDCPFNVDILCLQRLARTEMGTEMFPVGDLMGAWEGSLWGGEGGGGTLRASSASFFGHWVISMTWATRPSSRRGAMAAFREAQWVERERCGGRLRWDDRYCGAVGPLL
jgi:hypothetical protein